jgi:hypothetical protein
MNVAFDWSVKLGDVLTILAIAGTAIGFLYALRGKVEAIDNRLTHVEKDLGTFVDTLIQIGKQDERLDSHAQRIGELERAAPRTKRR